MVNEGLVRIGLRLLFVPVGAREHLQDHHHQQVPGAQGAHFPVGIQIVQLARDRLADGVLHEAHLPDDVALGDVDVRVGATLGVGAPDVIHVTGIIVIIHA